MTTDLHLARVIGWAVCFLAFVAVVAVAWQVVIENQKVDPDLKDLAVLLAGGLLGRLTTTRQPMEGDSPVPTTVVNTPSSPVPTTEAAVPADVHPDAPETSDL